MCSSDLLFIYEPFIRGAEILGPVLDAAGNPSGIRLNLTQNTALLNLLLTDKPDTELPPIPGFITGPALETTHQQMAALSLTFFDRHLLLQKEAENYLNQSSLDQLFGETDSFEILSGEFSWELEEQ